MYRLSKIIGTAACLVSAWLWLIPSADASRSQTVNQTGVVNMPAASAQKSPTKIIISTAGNDWHFIMGPAGSPIEGLWFYHGSPGHSKDAISISCRRATGDEAILFDVLVKGQAKTTDRLVQTNINVAGHAHSLTMHERDQGHHHIVLYAVGTAPAAIAYAMAALPIGQVADITIHVPGLGIFSAQVPTLRSTAQATGQICAAWHQKALH
jgi:hypothetical protein